VPAARAAHEPAEDAPERRQRTRIERAEDLVEHSRLLLRIRLRVDVAHHLPERRHLIGAQRIGDAVREVLLRRVLRHLVEVRFRVGCRLPAGHVQVLLQQTSEIEGH